MTPEVIKEFLVSLGFGVDSASLTGFVKAIAGATLKVEALYGAVKLAADTVFFAIAKISQGFEQMGYEFHLIAPAINRTLYLRQELLKAYAASGLSITHVIQQAVKLNYSLAKTKFAFQALYQSVASKFFDILAQRSDHLRAKIYQNMPAIQEILRRFVNAVFVGIDTIDRAIGRVYPIVKQIFDSIVGVFQRFNDATDGAAGKVAGLVAGLTILFSVLGPIATGIIILIGLYDDFKVWQEGGKSFFNWKNAVPVINAIKDALAGVASIVDTILEKIADSIVALYRFAVLAKGIVTFFHDSGDSGKKFSGFGNIDPSVLNGFASSQGLAPAIPLGSQYNGNQSNQNVNLKTDINIQSSPDALSTARATSGELGKTYGDFLRNLKAATGPG